MFRFRTGGDDGRAHGDQSLGVCLLRAVAGQGSITQAAKAFGMSYKAAWDAIGAMNGLAGEPPVERTTGGDSIWAIITA